MFLHIFVVFSLTIVLMHAFADSVRVGSHLFPFFTSYDCQDTWQCVSFISSDKLTFAFAWLTAWSYRVKLTVVLYQSHFIILDCNFLDLFVVFDQNSISVTRSSKQGAPFRHAWLHKPVCNELALLWPVQKSYNTSFTSYVFLLK